MTRRNPTPCRGDVGPIAVSTAVKRWSRTVAHRVVPLVGAAVVAMTMAPGVSAPASAQAEPVVSGLVTVRAVTDFDAQPAKTVKAKCPEGTNVVGGGASISGADERLTLTQLQPRADVDGHGRDAYIAAAAATSPELTDGWALVVVALCADTSSLPGWEIVSASTTNPPESMKRETVACPSGKKVLGTGAKISRNNGQIGLQVARADATGVLTRAQAHVDADGFEGTWSLTAFAICADAPSGYQVVTGVSEQSASETFKFAQAGCPGHQQVLSAGAAVTDVAPAGVSLRLVFPSTFVDEPHRFFATAAETTPTNEGWDVIARGICVDRPED